MTYPGRSPGLRVVAPCARPSRIAPVAEFLGAGLTAYSCGGSCGSGACPRTAFPLGPPRRAGTRIRAFSRAAGLLSRWHASRSGERCLKAGAPAHAEIRWTFTGRFGSDRRACGRGETGRRGRLQLECPGGKPPVQNRSKSGKANGLGGWRARSPGPMPIPSQALLRGRRCRDWTGGA